MIDSRKMIALVVTGFSVLALTGCASDTPEGSEDVEQADGEGDLDGNNEGAAATSAQELSAGGCTFYPSNPAKRYVLGAASVSSVGYAGCNPARSLGFTVCLQRYSGGWYNVKCTSRWLSISNTVQGRLSVGTGHTPAWWRSRVCLSGVGCAYSAHVNLR